MFTIQHSMNMRHSQVQSYENDVITLPAVLQRADQHFDRSLHPRLATIQFKECSCLALFNVRAQCDARRESLSVSRLS